MPIERVPGFEDEVAMNWKRAQAEMAEGRARRQAKKARRKLGGGDPVSPDQSVGTSLERRPKPRCVRRPFHLRPRN